MTDQERILLTGIESKIKQLIGRQEVLMKEKRQLQEKVVSLEETIAQLEDSNKELSRKYDNLKLAKMLAASDDENKDAKSRIQKIVREIDKCIALLNK